MTFPVGRNPVQIGEKQRRLTVLEKRPIADKPKGFYTLVCACECGERVEMPSMIFRRRAFCPKCDRKRYGLKRAARIFPGDVRGPYTVLETVAGSSQKHPRYRVRCKCGAESEISGGSLNNKAKACQACFVPLKMFRYAEGRDTNKWPLYRSWIAMRRRCNAVHDPRNHRYAGRGIKVCPEWNDSFEAFRDWSLGNGYEPGLSLDRLDADKGYSPDNCEWVTKSENSKRMMAMYSQIRKAKADQFPLSAYLPIEALFGAV